MLYESDGMTDVTLCCEDGRIRAHKLILSTCSDYFLELFLENVGKETYVVLQDINVAELKSILAFIYTGQIDVTDETLPGLLAAAETLGVRGLKGHSQALNDSTESSDEDDIAENDENDENDHDDNSAESQHFTSSQQQPQAQQQQQLNPQQLQNTQVKSEPVQIKSEQQENQIGDDLEDGEERLNIEMEENRNGTHAQDEQTSTNFGNPVTSTITPIQEAKFPSSTISPLKHPLYNLQQTFHPSLLHNTLATQNPSSGLSGNLASGLGGNLSANLAGNLTSAFPGNVATFGNTGMANFCSSGANLMTSINNSQAQMSPSVSVTQSGMSGGMAGLSGNIASSLAAMYHQVQAQQHQSPVKILPKISISEEESPLKQTENGKIQLELDSEAIRKILEGASSPVCPMCNKDCGNMPNLRSHLQVHNNLKPFACKFCDAKFARVSHLNRHIRVHTGEKPFSCELCNKSFARQDKLKVHLQRHTKDGNISLELSVGKKRAKKAKLDPAIDQLFNQNLAPNSMMDNSGGGSMNVVVGGGGSGVGHNGGSNLQNQTGYNPNSLWNGFPPQITNVYDQYESVYPGMMQFTTNNGTAGNGGGSSPAVMRIGECSIKPIGQS